MKQKIQIFLLDVFFGGREYKTQAATKRKPFPVIALFLALVSTLLILCTIFSVIRISELSAEIASLKKQEISLAAKVVSLENQLDHRYSIPEIRTFAIEKLGFSESGGKIIYVDTNAKNDSAENDSAETENSEDPS
ncbi:MAG: hypothetical protein IKW18_08280 [Clostridia bacterium]|nr:hypothetical protein [Clostridia bacterium]